MKKYFKIVFLLISIVVSEQSVALRCGNKLVDVGDSKPKVNFVCGEPDYKELREIAYPDYCSNRVDFNEQSSFYYRGRSRQYLPHHLNYTLCQYKTREVWIYNFGPRKFMRELIFYRGHIEEINALEYGY